MSLSTVLGCCVIADVYTLAESVNDITWVISLDSIGEVIFSDSPGLRFDRSRLYIAAPPNTRSLFLFFHWHAKVLTKRSLSITHSSSGSTTLDVSSDDRTGDTQRIESADNKTVSGGKSKDY